MKLIKLTAEQPSFKNIHFNTEGITLIVGDGSKERKTKKEGSSNGVGKTLTLGLIHHCLGANLNPKLKETIPDWVFQLHFSLNGKEHFVERSADGKKLILDDKSIKLKQYREWLNNCGTFRIDENLSGLSFRSLFTRFARLLREDCIDPIKTHKEQEVDARLRTLYLLGIDCILIAHKKAYKKHLDELKRTLKTWKNDQVLHEVFRAGSQPKIRFEWLEREIPRLKADLKRFKVADNYRSIEAEAQEKTEHLRQIKKQIAVLHFQIESINRALQQQPDISSAELLQLYEGLQSVFKPEALAHFEAVEQFHHGLAFDRKVRLEADRKKFSIEIEPLVEGDDSDGINSARILCFDWVLLMQGANHTMDFVWHDNRLFADMDPKSRTGWFKYILETLLGSGKQYIATLNTENYEAMREYLDEDQWNQLEQSKVLVLRGDKPDNKLLGIQFGGY